MSSIKQFFKRHVIDSGIYWNLHCLGQFVNRELKYGCDISLRKKLYAYRNGFSSEAIPLFKLDRRSEDDLLSHWQWLTGTQRLNGDSGILHANKLHMYYILYPEFKEKLPELFGYLDNGFVPVKFTDTSYSSLHECIEQEAPVILKPTRGVGGYGVKIIQSTDDYSPSMKEWNSTLVQNFASQADYSDDIYPTSSNTIRIVTMIDPDTGKPFIAGAVHRFGRNGLSVDNWASGGISAGVDIGSGELSEAVGSPHGDTLPEFKAHPDTGAQIHGVQIPGWESIYPCVLEMADYVGKLTPYVGWDILVTSNDGNFVILESNTFPDINVLQPHVPLLADDRVRRFYAHHGVI